MGYLQVLSICSHMFLFWLRVQDKEILFEKETPIFATLKAPITFVKNGVLDDRKMEMMNV